MHNLLELLKNNEYPGRGIVTGISKNNKHAFIAYFIMGRSENSRNRVFEIKDEGIATKAADPSKLQDPSLVIYSPVRVYKEYTIITNGDQTDTVYDAFAKKGEFEKTAAVNAFETALRTRTFEPDPPILTPRISALFSYCFEGFQYKMSILKSAGGNGKSAQKFFWEYESPLEGQGHFIHTYSGQTVNSRLESFNGEPVCVEIPENTEKFAEEIWEALNKDNKVSLFVRNIAADGTYKDKIFNKYNKA